MNEFRQCVAQDIEEWIGSIFLQSGILETGYNVTKRRPYGEGLYIGSESICTLTESET
jgi:hypothetical protein